MVILQHNKWPRTNKRREMRDRQAVFARITGTVILASSNLKSRPFEELSNKERFYPDGVYC